jgi:hypothetical protein
MILHAASLTKCRGRFAGACGESGDGFVQRPDKLDASGKEFKHSLDGATGSP